MSFLYMVREEEEARVGTTQNLLRYMRLFGPLERTSARWCSCGIYFPSKVGKIKRNRGEGDVGMSVMTFLYTRQLLAKKDEECVWDQTFTRKMITRLRCN